MNRTDDVDSFYESTFLNPCCLAAPDPKLRDSVLRWGRGARQNPCVVNLLPHPPNLVRSLKQTWIPIPLIADPVAGALVFSPPTVSASYMSPGLSFLVGFPTYKISCLSRGWGLVTS